jgi:hypothetical protein
MIVLPAPERRQAIGPRVAAGRKPWVRSGAAGGGEYGKAVRRAKA